MESRKYSILFAALVLSLLFFLISPFNGDEEKLEVKNE
jgi:hypothetical protein